MIFPSLTLLAVLVGVVRAAAVETEALRNSGDVPEKERPQSTTCLLPEALQNASVLTGQEVGTSGIGPGQVVSQTLVVSLQSKPELLS